MHRNRLGVFLLMALAYALIINHSMAQNCPADYLLAISRANAACIDLAPQSVCWGNGDVISTFYDDPTTDDTTLPEVGTRRASTYLHTLQTQATPAQYGIAKLTFQANLTRREPGRLVTALAFGDVQLSNDIVPIPAVTLTATGQANVRVLPDATVDIVQSFPLRTTFSANGVYEEGGWYRVLIPDTDRYGWVSETVVSVTGDSNQLLRVTPDDTIPRAFEALTLITGYDDAPCTGAPQSGLLLQTPNPGQNDVTLTINGYRMVLRGTAFLQTPTDTSLTVAVFDGQAQITINEQSELIPSGTMTTLTASGVEAAMPYDLATFAGLPINSLAYRIVIAPPRSQEAIDAYILQASITPTPPPSPEERLALICQRRTTRPTTVWGGPGTNYEAISDLARDERVAPVLQIRFTTGEVWWQLRTGGWIQAAHVESTEACGDVPVTETVPAPRSNTLIMETCESTNGPIRAGQMVRLEFTHGSWETFGEANEAVRIDPGRVIINNDTYRTQSSNPFLVAENPERWYRRFWYNWPAESGVYRIVGERLTYSVTCDITVPVG